MKKSLYILLLLLVSLLKARSQNDIKSNAQTGQTRYKTNLIISASGLSYKGDVCKGCLNTGYSLGLSSRFRFNNRLYFRPEYVFNRIQSGIDTKSKLSFKNNTHSVVLNFEYGLIAPEKGSVSRPKNEIFLCLSPFVMHHNPFTEINGKKTYLAPLLTENKNYSKLITGVRLGLETSFELSKDKRLGVFADYQLLFSDYLDDVSKNYVDYSKTYTNRSLAIDPTQTAEIGSKRGNSSPFDGFFRLGLSFEFGYSVL
jgi:hypothetical protein